MIPDATRTLRQRHSMADKESSELTPQQLRRLSQTAAELLADSMFNTSTAVNDDKYQPTSASLHSRLSHFQQQQLRPHNFDTYPPPKKNDGFHTLLMQKKASSSLHSLDQPKTLTTMSIRSSPLRSTAMGKFYTKRAAAIATRSFSESSAERQLHKKYTSSDDSSQDEDELMMSLTAAEKRKMTRRSFSNGLQQAHKYKPVHTATSVPEDDPASCAIFGKRSQHISDMIDIAIRVVLVIVFSKLETQTAFKRVIHPEELWMYKNPRTKDYVSPLSLILAVIFGPFGVTLLNLMLTKDRRDFRAASWAWTLCLGLNGLATSLLKISVGRPRPDYFFRCFPDGVINLAANATGSENMLDLFNCTGNFRDINEGHKSFPSGHSSFAFAGFGFITYYVGAKLNAFNRRGRGETWRLFVALTPLVIAALIAVSRTCDYHHHWEDVTAGGIIGLGVSYYVYRQYYPSIFVPNCHRSFSRSIHQVKTAGAQEPVTSRHRRRLLSYKRLPSEECGEAALLCEEQGDDAEKRPLVNDQ